MVNKEEALILLLKCADFDNDTKNLEKTHYFFFWMCRFRKLNRSMENAVGFVTLMHVPLLSTNTTDIEHSIQRMQVSGSPAFSGTSDEPVYNSAIPAKTSEIFFQRRPYTTIHLDPARFIWNKRHIGH
ncbi:MAG: hypothetical protein MUO31_05475 [Thermodesulfovibrionales bacterium]|nr:hypothetical protein [Thermodesulfovibrionales bacterium]